MLLGCRYGSVVFIHLFKFFIWLAARDINRFFVDGGCVIEITEITETNSFVFSL